MRLSDMTCIFSAIYICGALVALDSVVSLITLGILFFVVSIVSIFWER